MPDTVTELARRGLALEPKDRQRLVDLLRDSLPESDEAGDAGVDVDVAWRQEIKRRVGAYERGEAVLFDADEVMAEAKRIAPSSVFAWTPPRGPNCCTRRNTIKIFAQDWARVFVRQSMICSGKLNKSRTAANQTSKRVGA